LLLKNLRIVANTFRPPGGRRIRAGELARLWAAGFKVVLWSFDTHDSKRGEGKWKGPPPDYASVRPGDIVLMHDDNPVCVEELPRLIEAIKAKNLTPVTVSKIVNSEW
jgi:peptidoglycan/xylan/chitin deacetylase (PgdA/CDA1 family)